MHISRNPRNIKKVFPKKSVFLLLTLIFLINGLNAQTNFPAGDFWSLDAGVGMTSILVDGVSFQAVLDPKLWLSPPLMVGSKIGVNFSPENYDDEKESDLGSILTFEGLVYLRWNFLRLGRNPQKETNIFLQGGIGMVAAYRGHDNPFDDVTKTRGSLMADAALGVTIPLTPRWHIEPQVRGGYPHIMGVSVTAGYKFPLPQKTTYQYLPGRTEYVEVIRTLPPNEVIKRIMISSVEYVLFGPDIGRYNIGIDRDAQQLNELVLNYTAQTLRDNPNYRVRIEGHANPFTVELSEAEELMTLSSMRANVVADQLRAKGISDDQMVIIAFGGTRAATSEFDVRNRNRRVELIMIQVDAD